jgi:hypothetical protein
MPDFNGPAKLYRLEMTTVELGNKLSSRHLVHSGTAAECINKVMAEPEPDRALYTMTVDLENRFGITDRIYQDMVELDYGAIVAASQRPDFPKA